MVGQVVSRDQTEIDGEDLTLIKEWLIVLNEKGIFRTINEISINVVHQRRNTNLI